MIYLIAEHIIISSVPKYLETINFLHLQYKAEDKVMFFAKLVRTLKNRQTGL